MKSKYNFKLFSHLSSKPFVMPSLLVASSLLFKKNGGSKYIKVTDESGIVFNFFKVSEQNILFCAIFYIFSYWIYVLLEFK